MSTLPYAEEAETLLVTSSPGILRSSIACTADFIKGNKAGNLRIGEQAEAKMSVAKSGFMQLVMDLSKKL